MASGNSPFWAGPAEEIAEEVAFDPNAGKLFLQVHNFSFFFSVFKL
jgi:hypothetical protein